MSDMADVPVREAIRRINAKADLKLYPAPSANSPASTTFHRSRAGEKGLAFTNAAMKASVVRKQA